MSGILYQVRACNYQVELQVTAAQHISRGYDEAALLLTFTSPTLHAHTDRLQKGNRN